MSTIRADCLAKALVLFALLTLVLGDSQVLAQASDFDQLKQLNQDYLQSYLNGNAQRFDEILAADYRETATDGTILNKTEFLNKIAARENSSQLKIEASELEIRVFGDLAIVHAIPLFTLTNGSTRSGGRYTDVYARIEGEWLCVAAHLGG